MNRIRAKKKEAKPVTGIPAGDVAALFEEIYAAWRVPARKSVVEWCEENLELDPKYNVEGGPIRIRERTPYLVEVMENAGDPEVQEVVLMWGTQLGKTTDLNGCCAYWVDQDPAPGMYIMPSQETARLLSDRRLKRMFEYSPKLRRHVPASKEKWTQFKLEFDAMPLDVAWAGSPAKLASQAIRYVVQDEIDKYPPPGKEGDAVDLAEERTKTYGRKKKIIKCSTPTTALEGRIDKEFDKTDRRRFYVPCPHCGAYQTLKFSMAGENHRLRWPKDERNPRTIKEQRLAWYDCEACGGRIEDADKPAMLKRGVWCPECQTVNAQGELEGTPPPKSRRGYHLNSLYSPWLTFSDIAAAFLESKGEAGKLQNFVNSTLAEVWQGEVENLDDKAATDASKGTGYLLAECREGEISRVPEWVRVLTAGVDVQKTHIKYSIWGWAPGEEAALVDAGFCGDFEALDKRVYNRSFLVGTGGAMLNVLGVAVDAGYRTWEVYQYARMRMDRVRAIRGSTEPMVTPWTASAIDKDETGTKLDASYLYYRLDTAFYKNKISTLLANKKVKFPEDVSEDFMREFLSERIVLERNKYGVTKRVWAKRSKNAANHWWDTSVYAVAMADMLYVWAMPQDFGVPVASAEGQAPEEPPTERTRPEREAGGFARAWGQRRRNR